MTDENSPTAANTARASPAVGTPKRFQRRAYYKQCDAVQNNFTLEEWNLKPADEQAKFINHRRKRTSLLGFALAADELLRRYCGLVEKINHAVWDCTFTIGGTR